MDYLGRIVFPLVLVSLGTALTVGNRWASGHLRGGSALDAVRNPGLQLHLIRMSRALYIGAGVSMIFVGVSLAFGLRIVSGESFWAVPILATMVGWVVLTFRP